ncbi:MAG: OB-fold domain-containing protein, partial [Actinomycetota bacterium]|nr:OB-fold domain-containing protein [Actinomycetota bacterium]
DRLPYAVLIVEFAEQVNLRIVGNLVGSQPTELAIGTPMQVVYEKINDEVTLPQWRIAGAEGDVK